MTKPFAPGDRVRVKRDCPLTLPAFAQVQQGVVVDVGPNETVEVEFGDRTYPIPLRWLEALEDETED